MEFPGLINYWIVVVLMMTGFYIVIAHNNLVKKIVGLNIFQVSMFTFYITMGKVKGGTAPILAEGIAQYSNPLPHVLILTAIVDQIPALQVVLALLAAPMCLILRRPRVAWLVALIVTWASLAMALILLFSTLKSG